MSRTIRYKNEAYRRWWWCDTEDEQYKCHRCNGYHGKRFYGNLPICADGVYSETPQNRTLKDDRRHRDRKIAKKFVQDYLSDKDIENIPYPCNKDIRMDYYLL